MSGEQPMDDQQLSTLNISWQTRLLSVMRQFDKLTQKPAYDKKNDQMVDFMGMSVVRGVPIIQVRPTDGGAIYCAKCEELDV